MSLILHLDELNLTLPRIVPLCLPLSEFNLIPCNTPLVSKLPQVLHGTSLIKIHNQAETLDSKALIPLTLQ